MKTYIAKHERLYRGNTLENWQRDREFEYTHEVSQDAFNSFRMIHEFAGHTVLEDDNKIWAVTQTSYDEMYRDTIYKH